MQVVCTFFSSTAKTSAVAPVFYFMVSITTMPPFNEKKKAKIYSILAISLPAEKEVVSHTVRAWKTRRNFDLDGTRAFAKR